MEPKKILLTTDLSDESLRAFGPVAGLARQLGVAITLLHVVEDVLIPPHGAPLAPPMHAPDFEQHFKEARELLEERRKEMGADLDVKLVVESGSDVAKVITDYAAENGMDLVAISSHGRSGFRRLVMGSVAERVLRHSTVPVLVFPRHE
jgi:nucleotide-binding universal stress UspA family protein